MRAAAERDHLDRHVGQRGLGQQVLQLQAHQPGAADLAAQRGLVQHGPDLRRVVPDHGGLAGHPQRDLALDVLGRAVHHPGPDHGPGVVLGLQQPGDQADLVDPDLRCRALQADIRGELRLHGVAVRVPPALLARVAGQLDQALPLGGGHAVELEHVADVPWRDRHPAGLHAADLGGRAFQVLRNFLAGQPGRLAEPPELEREPAPPHRGAVFGCHLSPPPEERDVRGSLSVPPERHRRLVTPGSGSD